jgi:hypothetical protein
MQSLWDAPDLCRRLGAAGRAKASAEYAPSTYYRRLTAVYRDAIAETASVPHSELLPLAHRS